MVQVFSLQKYLDIFLLPFMAKSPTVWLEERKKKKKTTPAATLTKITFASNAESVDQNSLVSWCIEDEQNSF